MKKIWKIYKDTPLLTKMFVALILGVIFGFIMGPKAAALAPLGTLFLTLLQMIALPLIICNLLAGLCSLGDPKLFGKIGGKVLIYYFCTTVFAMVIAVVIGTIVKPGVGFTLAGDYTLTTDATPSIGATILAMIPNNIFTALDNGKFDQVVVFVALFGVATLFIPAEERERIGSFCATLSKVFGKIMGAIMLYAPVGIFALMAKIFGTYGADIGGSIAKYVASVYLSVICTVVMYLIILYVFTRVKPLYFLKKSAPLAVSAASTCSSIATLPVSLACADDLGIPKGISNFTLPLGNQLNKDGMGIFFAMSFMFTAQAAGVTFEPLVLGRMILLGLLLTTGGGGIPGGAMVFLAMILDSFGLPVEVVGIIAGIHTINEMGLTTLNCMGDLVGTMVATFSGKDREKLVIKE